MTDDQGYGDFGSMGNPVVRTPHLDGMAARGAQMSPFYVSPVCSLTRASARHGIPDLGSCRRMEPSVRERAGFAVLTLGAEAGNGRAKRVARLSPTGRN